MLRATSFLVRALNVLNWVILVAFGVMVLGSYLAEPILLEKLAVKFGPRGPAVLNDFRLLLPILIVTGIAAHYVFTRLNGILATVEAGDAFAGVNGARLRTIGWALLSIQIADLALGALALRISANSGEYFGWSFSIGGWLAVLLVFVLARVFSQGAAMRDELDGTV